MHGEISKWLPYAEFLQEHDAAPKSKRASGEGDQHGFGKEPAQDAIAAGAERETQSNFAGPVSGTCGEETAEVGACRQENQAGKQHQSGEECLKRKANLIAEKP